MLCFDFPLTQGISGGASTFPKIMYNIKPVEPPYYRIFKVKINFTRLQRSHTTTL